MGTKKQKKKTQESRRARKPARRDSEVEKATPQPLWWRKRRLDKSKWGKDDVMDAGDVEMALADGEDPSGRVAVVNMAEAKELRKQAAPHSIQKLLWLSPEEQEELEFNDESLCPKDHAVKRKVYFEKTRPCTRFILPLHVEA